MVQNTPENVGRVFQGVLMGFKPGSQIDLLHQLRRKFFFVHCL